MSQCVLEARGLRVLHPGRKPGAPPTVALERLDFELEQGQCLGWIGASGSGKSSALRALVGLLPAAQGSVLYRDALGAEHELLGRGWRAWRKLRREIAIVTQDPFTSLDPRYSAGESVAEGLRVLGLARGAELERRVSAALESVGVAAVEARRFPHQLSGGQRQRVALARALVLEPRVLLCDEITSALDLCVQAQILARLARVRRESGMACILVTHDLALARQHCDAALVLHEGRVVEAGPVDVLCRAPRSPQTRALLEALPRRTRALFGD